MSGFLEPVSNSVFVFGCTLFRHETNWSELLQYRQKYRAVYASPEWPGVGQNLSWIHVLDDHEIQNDWDGYVLARPCALWLFSRTI